MGLLSDAGIFVATDVVKNILLKMTKGMFSMNPKGGDMSKSKKQTKAEIEKAKREEAIERRRQEVVAHAISAVQHNFGKKSAGRVSIYKR